ncbi:MAG: outer membrane beta-barrel protein [Bacteroidales bacterium]|jgi:hypothetical protein|nr:outer membrane beta-barrel protein [Bacteroidales bacterium]
MKIKYILIVFLLAVPELLFSQGFKGGVMGGLNAARIDNDGDELYGKLGLNAGAFVARDIIPGMLEWQMEVKYTSRGKYNIDRDIQGNVIGLRMIDLKYVELPLSMQYRLNDKMQIGLGLSPDVLLKASYFDQDGILPPPYDYPNDVQSEKLFIIGLTAFGEFNYFVLDALAVGVRFNYSVFPFEKSDGYAVRYRDSGWFHDVLSINGKYYFTRK